MANNTPPPPPDQRPIIAGKRVNGWKQVRSELPVFSASAKGKVPPAPPGTKVNEGVTVKPRTPPKAPSDVNIAGRNVPGYRQVKPDNPREGVIRVITPKPPVTNQTPPSPPSRTSTLQGRGGVLGGQHAGGHSDVMGAINLGGFTVKTPIIKPTSTKNK